MIPPVILGQLIKVVIELAKTAVVGRKIVRKIDVLRIGDLSVQILRRVSLGKDKAISQIVKIQKDNITQEVWQIVVKGSQVIHKHLKYKRR